MRVELCTGLADGERGAVLQLQGHSLAEPAALLAADRHHRGLQAGDRTAADRAVFGDLALSAVGPRVVAGAAHAAAASGEPRAGGVEPEWLDWRRLVLTTR